MLWIFSSILVVLWIVGLIKEPMGGFIHVLLVLALVAAGTELALLWRKRDWFKQKSSGSNAEDAEGAGETTVEDKPTSIPGHDRFPGRSA